MSTTMTLPLPPPTLNTLGPAERTRLLRSTRKLGRVLGATPLVLDPHAPAPAPSSSAYKTTQNSTYSPSTPVLTPARRAARMFSTHTPASSISSMASIASEPEYVVVRPSGPGAEYQPTTLGRLSYELYGGRRSAEESRKAPARDEERKRKPLGALPPIALVFDIPLSSSGRQQGRTHAPSSAQPLLLRVRPSGDSTATTDRTLSEQNTLSPISAVFNMNMPTTPTSPTSTIAPSSSPAHGMNDRDKRRKMAKLARTLGENVPPELVFRSASVTAASGAMGRERSASISKTARRASVALASRPSIPRFTPQPPVLAVSATPTPPSPMDISPSTEAPQRKRKHRPRSLTLGSASAIAAATRKVERLEKERTERGTQSMDAPRTLSRAELPLRTHSRQVSQAHARPYSRSASRMDVEPPLPAPLYPLPSTPFVPPFSLRVDLPAVDNPPMQPVDSVAYGRRKEREWSGEWNVRDMDDVTRRLRGLRGR